ncbi:hypothetical protein C0J50_12297 [Silurus asotus]|uniref:Uncharacterized protein n=1 Tax=Silurus asotus TaxID=30991 RepID=A0AAD5A2P6_SILAS|nr:hypothetical protein C0J50_12297 [Silurus asotus]
MEKVVTDLDAFSNLLKEKITEKKGEKAILLQTVQKLEATLAFERRQQEQDITERNSTHLQNITELQSSLQLCKKQEKTVEREKESWTREQEQLQECVAQLEVTLKSEKVKKAKLDMKEMNTVQIQTFRELQDSLDHCEEENRNLIADRERVETRLAVLEVELEFERKKIVKEKKKAKLNMEEMTTLHFLSTRKLQDSLNHCVEEKKIIDLMRERERLEEHVV